MDIRRTLVAFALRLGLPLSAYLLTARYSEEMATEIAVFTLGFYVLVLLFLSTASRSKAGVTSLGYGFVKTMLRVISPFIWALIALTLLYSLTHVVRYHGPRGGSYAFCIGL